MAVVCRRDHRLMLTNSSESFILRCELANPT
jgi:hypothetical protein